MNTLNQEIVNHWQDLRQRTYDLIDLVTQEDVAKTLPFEKSQSLGNQFFCMTGTQETFAKAYLESGKWDGWSCSLDEGDNPKLADVKARMQAADKILLAVLEKADLLQKVGDGTLLSRYLALVEHESHNQGQIINFIYALDLRIPQSWTNKWGLEK